MLLRGVRVDPVSGGDGVGYCRTWSEPLGGSCLRSCLRRSCSRTVATALAACALSVSKMSRSMWSRLSSRDSLPNSVRAAPSSSPPPAARRAELGRDLGGEIADCRLACTAAAPLPCAANAACVDGACSRALRGRAGWLGADGAPRALLVPSQPDS